MEDKEQRPTWMERASMASCGVGLLGLAAALLPLYLLGASVPFIDWSPGCLVFDCVKEPARTPPSHWRWDILGRLLGFGFGIYYLAGLLFTWLNRGPAQKREGFFSQTALVLGIALLLSCCALIVGFLIPPQAIDRLFATLTD
jgi:hypothetical protein